MPDPTDAFKVLADQLRERDRDRFIADLFAPEAARQHLLALHVFDAEIARIRFAVSEPALGEMRLQWWRDAIANAEGGGHPLAEALLETISILALPVPVLLALLDARIFDLYNDPMPSLADFEGYAGETSSALLQFGLIALGSGGHPAAADAAGHAGVASVLSASLRRFGTDAKRQQLFLPRDVLERRGVVLDDVYAAKATPQLSSALAELCGSARDHLASAMRSAALLPRSAAPVFLPLAVIDADLTRLEKRVVDPFSSTRDLPRWRRQWLIWRTARRGFR